jgi:CheY-like chemotaxis protein
VGIRQEDLNRLFSEYSQVNKQANKAIEGTGLGLSISKRLTELMGGHIRAESEYGNGSTFTAEILQEIADGTPIGEEKAFALANFSYVPESKSMSFEFQPMPNGKVLIVDDVEINLIVAATLLEPYQMKVDCVDNGYDSVELIRGGEPRYDIVFMDQMMPGMDGIEAVAAIRALGTEYARSLPIVALSANAIAGSEKMFLDHGFQDFLAKPIEQDKLDALLHKWVSAD